MKAATLKMEALEEKLHTTPAEPAVAPVAVAPAASEPITASIGSASRTLSTAAAIPAQGAMEEKPSPLYFRIGTAEFYPLGFMDATAIYRTVDMVGQGGGSIGTSFGGISYNNTVPGRLSDLKFSAQNSRIGMRVHSKVGDHGDITGYLEADFLGYLAPSGNITSNSDSLRLRLYWANYKWGKYEVQGGQSWSLLTPNRNGLSALPGDLFYGQEVDTNYYLGLTYTRATGIRVIAHPTKNWAIGVSLENPQQTLPNTVLTPANITAIAAVGATGTYGGQFDTNSGNTSNATGVNNTSIPNLAPDIILKTSFDAVPGGHHVHFDLAGLERTFKAVNLLTTPTSGTVVTSNATKYSTIHGGGLAYTLNVELIKNLRLINTGFYSYGGGRYIGNTSGPDVIVKSDGNLSGIHASSGLAGFEYQVTPKWLFYGYYSAAYFGKNLTDNGGGTFAGYGAPGAANSASANRYLYEPTFGFVNTVWRNASYGDMKIITQLSYVSRTPWAVSAGSPATAHTGMVYINLRYDLP
jgi:hypothetical protein